jgi:hypothetical protein
VKSPLNAILEQTQTRRLNPRLRLREAAEALLKNARYALHVLDKSSVVYDGRRPLPWLLASKPVPYQ